MIMSGFGYQLLPIAEKANVHQQSMLSTVFALKVLP